eukprot:scaffold630_cov218-Pinguiococcus_pyrenoidosus.AAC.7
MPTPETRNLASGVTIKCVASTQRRAAPARWAVRIAPPIWHRKDQTVASWTPCRDPDESSAKRTRRQPPSDPEHARILSKGDRKHMPEKGQATTK